MKTLLVPDSCNVYTPIELASAILDSLGDVPNGRWLEPSHGLGAFVHALHDVGVHKNRIRAIDLDRVPRPADRKARTIRGVDFLAWSRQTTERFDRIVGNPPFVAIRSLGRMLRETAATTQFSNAPPVGQNGNMWYAFFCASLNLLRRCGAISFVLPASAEYADYARPVREQLTRLFERVDVYRSRRPLFVEVQEGCVVLVCRNYLFPGQGVYRRREFQNITALSTELRLGASRRARVCPPDLRSDTNSIEFAQIAEIALGGVTGDADYFLLTEPRRIELGLPVASLRPVVTKARHIVAPLMNKCLWRQLRDSGERVWIFRPTGRSLVHPAVRRYLRLHAESGGCQRNRYKIRNRDPWHQTPLPRNPHGFISGMGRFGPLLCINEMPGLNASNTLYTVRFYADVGVQQRYAYALALLTSEVRQQVRRSIRVYPDGLAKLEPGQIARLRIPRLRSSRGAKSAYQAALKCLFDDEPRRAQDIGDSWIECI